jgi:hypothetical protein
MLKNLSKLPLTKEEEDTFAKYNKGIQPKVMDIQI